MGTKFRIFFSVIFLLLSAKTPAQIKVSSLALNESGGIDSILYDSSPLRKVELLDRGWKCYYESAPQNKIAVSAPALFEGKNSLIFEKRFYLNSADFQNKQLVLGFLGINYSGEVSINGVNIYKHNGGSYPFEIALPKDILKEEANNYITIKIHSSLNSENTFPVEQRFLFPNDGKGILRNVYMKYVNNSHITYSAINYKLDPTLTRANIKFRIGVGNSDFNRDAENKGSSNYSFRISIVHKGTRQAVVDSKIDFSIANNTEDYESNFSADISNPQLWSPESPNQYDCEISLFKDGILADQSIKRIAFYTFKNESGQLSLNGSNFKFYGTVFFLDESVLNKNNSNEKIISELSLIKSAGFNAVRFSKTFPHPFAIQVCQDLGLFSLIELPVNSIPEEILESDAFQLNSVQYIKSIISHYKEYANAIIIGTGSSFLPNSAINENFISKLSKVISEKGLTSYASFFGIQKNKIENLDLYGIEIYAAPINLFETSLNEAAQNIGKEFLFISELSYPNYKGSASGYLEKNSSEAQAKFYEDYLIYIEKEKLSGLVINSFRNFKMPFTSLFGGFNSNSKANLGMIESSKQTRSIAFKVVESRLLKKPKVTIPIGSSKDESPIFFILVALGLSIFMAILINTRKKFREDCTRALLRPYNFFADVRDHRILTGLHAILLMLVQAGSASLVVTITLFYLRGNILLEKLILAFGERSLLWLVSYLAWNPTHSFIILFFVFVVLLLITGAVIKFASFFIKTRVEYLSIVYSIIWASLPLTLLIPVELVLYKVFSLGAYNWIVFAFLVLFIIWVLQRIFKGIYVIFDVSAFKVYSYAFLIILVLAGGILLRYQFTHSTFYYITNAIKQYNSLIF